MTDVIQYSKASTTKPKTDRKKIKINHHPLKISFRGPVQASEGCKGLEQIDLGFEIQSLRYKLPFLKCVQTCGVILFSKVVPIQG